MRNIIIPKHYRIIAHRLFASTNHNLIIWKISIGFGFCSDKYIYSACYIPQRANSVIFTYVFFNCSIVSSFCIVFKSTFSRCGVVTSCWSSKNRKIPNCSIINSTCVLVKSLESNCSFSRSCAYIKYVMSIAVLFSED